MRGRKPDSGRRGTGGGDGRKRLGGILLFLLLWRAWRRACIPGYELFAFATIIAWFYLGSQALSYLTEGKPWKKSVQLCYGFFYLNAVFFGCVARLTLVWDLSDIFNGLMAVPNLIGLFLLRRQVEKPWEGEEGKGMKPLETDAPGKNFSCSILKVNEICA